MAMDTAMVVATGADRAREEILGTAEEVLARLAPDLPDDARVLLRQLHAGLPTGELVAEPPEALAGRF